MKQFRKCFLISSLLISYKFMSDINFQHQIFFNQEVMRTLNICCTDGTNYPHFYFQSTDVPKSLTTCLLSLNRISPLPYPLHLLLYQQNCTMYYSKLSNNEAASLYVSCVLDLTISFLLDLIGRWVKQLNMQIVVFLEFLFAFFAYARIVFSTDNFQ